MASPTLAEIYANGWDLSVHCPACRVLVAPIDVGGLLKRRSFATRLEDLRFVCRRCGGPGNPTVRASGNMLVGRPVIWPAAGTTPRT